MAIRTSYVGSESVGDVLTKANFDRLPNGLIGYAIVTANQGSITANVDLTGLVVTSVVPQASRMIRISWNVMFSDTVANGTTETFRIVCVKDGATIGQYDYSSNPGAGTNQVTASGFVLDVAPTNAVHTYKLQGGRSGTATGTFTIVASATNPATIAVTDEGPSF